MFLRKNSIYFLISQTKKSMDNPLQIAVDFDGTIVEHQFPHIGKPVPFAIEALIELQKKGHKIILWTFRYGKELNEAIDYCRSKGLIFYAVNNSYPEEKFDGSVGRKIYADIYIDDRNLGGLPPWSEIFRMIIGDDLVLKQRKLPSIIRFWNNLSLILRYF